MITAEQHEKMEKSIQRVRASLDGLPLGIAVNVLVACAAELIVGHTPKPMHHKMYKMVGDEVQRMGRIMEKNKGLKGAPVTPSQH